MTDRGSSGAGGPVEEAVRSVLGLIEADSWKSLVLRTVALVTGGLAVWAGWFLWNVQPLLVDQLKDSPAASIQALWPRERLRVLGVIEDAINGHGEEVVSAKLIAPASPRRFEVIWEIHKDHDRKGRLEVGDIFALHPELSEPLGRSILGSCGELKKEKTIEILCPIDGPRQVRGLLHVTLEREDTLSRNELADWHGVARVLSDLFYPRLRS